MGKGKNLNPADAYRKSEIYPYHHFTHEWTIGKALRKKEIKKARKLTSFVSELKYITRLHVVE
jgi:hypothetical protein